MTFLKLVLFSIFYCLSNCDINFHFNNTRMNCVCDRCECSYTEHNKEFITPSNSPICPTVSECQKGFVKLSTGCYHFSEIATTFSSAHQYCKGFDSKLISFESAEEIKVIKQKIYDMIAYADAAFWTSGNDLKTAGQLIWSEIPYVEIRVTDFCSGEPVSNSDRRCIQIWNWGGKNCWYKWKCGDSLYDNRILFRPICEA